MKPRRHKGDFDQEISPEDGRSLREIMRAAKERTREEAEQRELEAYEKAIADPYAWMDVEPYGGLSEEG